MDLKKIIKNKRNLLIGGVAIATLLTLTGCGKKADKVKDYEKTFEGIVSNVVNEVENEVITDINNEVKNMVKTETTQTQEEYIEELFMNKIKENDNTNDEKLLDYKVDEVKIVSDSEKKSILEFDAGQYFKDTDTLAYVTYSVKPKDVNNTNWISGNGEIKGDWITKSACVCVRDGEIISLGTSW